MLYNPIGGVGNRALRQAFGDRVSL
jgi:hypothetical protein